ncbi:plastocyanin/azurin family copper-binding protein [Fulvivirgaceae bacterium BMA10]|uniref:Plastocyanin/azurin family copper-binding protein n=1 Tax=Splendidivirga corallicola TaxID=3051826 RepID=A0ABT8KVA9_9BACT|nr:plastocyanin/azurin family copper-binding protein [Fulvivirgaceae bacterium BMA10]
MIYFKNIKLYLLIICLTCSFGFVQGQGNASIQKEGDYYKIANVPIPEDIILEVGGLCTLPNGNVAVSTRRGEIWIVENPTGPKPFYRKFASGLHEILGLRFKDDAFYCAQRGELTKLMDKNGDGEADVYETVYAWPLSGHYHEYSFGPIMADDGSMYVTGNVAFGNQEWWRGESRVPWRGWTMLISPDGKMEPFATGMRSPCGIGMVDGEFFYADNQGDWMGSGAVVHVEKGDFTGHPAGLRWADRPESPVKLTDEELYKVVDARFPPKGGPYVRLQNIEDEEVVPFYTLKEKFADVKPPAVWLPHGILGTSTSEIIVDGTKGGFGPFENQLLVGDQGQSKIVRVFLEKVNGQYQGASFAFREGFQSGVLRMAWGADNSLYVGQTNRGWGSTGESPYGLQRLIWSGKTPFEMKAVRAMPDGFEIEFTLPVDKKLASNPDAYSITGFTYKYHPVYGSPVVNDKVCHIVGVKVSEDGRKVRLVADSLRTYYIHEVKAEGVKSQDKQLSLLHNTAYYTLNQIPSGPKLSISELSVRPKKIEEPKPVVKKKAQPKADVEEKPKTNAVLAKRQTKLPSGWGKVDQTIQMGTKPGLKFDKTTITVKAGSKVKFTFNNTDDMPHNFLIVKPGTANDVGQAALNLGLKAASMNYVPKMDEVLYHTELVSPGGHDTIYFMAPDKPGKYTYVCTYPGHYVVMQGTLEVVE